MHCGQFSHVFMLTLFEQWMQTKLNCLYLYAMLANSIRLLRYTSSLNPCHTQQNTQTDTRMVTLTKASYLTRSKFITALLYSSHCPLWHITHCTIYFNDRYISKYFWYLHSMKLEEYCRNERLCWWLHLVPEIWE